MTKPKTVIFAPFSKVEKQDDGTLIVTGVASTESKDSDGEIVKADAVRQALPDYMQFANIREMHQPIAAGTAISATVDDAGVTKLEAHVVDPTSVLKVETGVLKGFSLGGRITKRDPLNKKIITGLRIGEISLVDRPANPDAVFTVVKFDKDGRAVTEAPARLRKGMYDVSILAELITRLNSLMCWAQDEANWEGDASDIPARLKESVAALCGVLRDMVDEETRELLGIADEIVAEDAIEVLAEAAKAIKGGKIVTVDFFADALEKKGAKFSKATVGTLAVVHKMLTDGCGMMEKLGYADTANQEDDEAMKTDDGKGGAPDANAETLAKAAKADALETENAALKDQLAKSTKAVDEATNELKKANETSQKLADAIVAKGMVRSVSKTDDAAGGNTAADELEKAKKAEKPVDMQAELRRSFAKPLSPIRSSAGR